MFLEPSETMSSKQTKLRYRKLLCLRVLVLALLALLFAEPVIKGIKLLGGGAKRHLVVIDTSLSQSHTARWQRTRTLAGDILDSLPDGDEVAIVAAASRFVQPAGAGDDSNDFSQSSARNQINALTPTSGRLDYSRIASAISGAVKDSPLPVEVHIVTDIQQSAMPERFTDLAIDGIDKLTIHSSADATDSNLSLSAKLDYAADNFADISVLVSNYSDQAAQRQISVTANDTVIESTTITVAADATALFQFNAADTTNAQGQLEIALSPNDELPIDDVWTLAVPDGDRTDVSVVSGSVQSIASNYVSAAIESDPRYRKRDIAGDNLSAGDAGAVVIVPDAAVLSDRAATRLQQFIADGGNALIIAGSTPHSTQMRKLLSISNSARNELNNDAAAPVSARSIANIDTTHPLTRDVAGSWRAVSVINYLPLNVQNTDRRIVDLGDGSPLLFERTIGEGRALFFASALDTGWNNLAVEPLFVAFMIRTVEYLSGDTSTNPYRSVGDAVTLPPGAQILDPTGTPLRELSALSEKGSIRLETAGIYTIRSATGKKKLSVNSDPRESNLQTIDDGSLARWRSIVDIKPADNTASINTEQNFNKGFWRWLLPLLVIIVLTESLFSHRHLWIKRGA